MISIENIGQIAPIRHSIDLLKRCAGDISRSALSGGFPLEKDLAYLYDPPAKFEILLTTCSALFLFLITSCTGISSFSTLLVLSSLTHYVMTLSDKEITGVLLGALSLAAWKVSNIAAEHRKTEAEALKSQPAQRSTEKLPRFFGRYITSYGNAKLGKPISSVICSEEEIRAMVNTFRYIVCSLVCISIFTCDFNIYPRYKMKCKEFGLSLMDFGVTAFMFNAGIICARSHKFRAQKTLYLLALGFIRLAVLSSGYHSEPSEYGTHLNFYFVYVGSEILSVFLRGCRSWAVLLCCFSLHEMIITQKDVVRYVMRSERGGFFSANREGLLSLLPYVGVLFLGKYVGELLFKEKETRKEKGAKLLGVSLGLFAVHEFCGTYSLPSRRLCNLSFTSFSCGAILLPMSLAFFLSSGLDVTALGKMGQMSKMMGPIFLWSNILVFAGNLLFDWRAFGRASSHLINLAYLMAVFILPYLLISRPGMDRWLNKPSNTREKQNSRNLSAADRSQKMK